MFAPQVAWFERQIRERFDEALAGNPADPQRALQEEYDKLLPVVRTWPSLVPYLDQQAQLRIDRLPPAARPSSPMAAPSSLGYPTTELGLAVDDFLLRSNQVNRQPLASYQEITDAYAPLWRDLATLREENRDPVTQHRLENVAFNLRSAEEQMMRQVGTRAPLANAPAPSASPPEPMATRR